MMWMPLHVIFHVNSLQISHCYLSVRGIHRLDFEKKKHFKWQADDGDHHRICSEDGKWHYLIFYVPWPDQCNVPCPDPKIALRFILKKSSDRTAIWSHARAANEDRTRDPPLWWFLSNRSLCGAFVKRRIPIISPDAHIRFHCFFLRNGTFPNRLLSTNL